MKGGPDIASAEMRFPKALPAADRNKVAALLPEPIDYIDNEQFVQPDAEGAIFADDQHVPRASTGWYSRLAHDRKVDTSLKASTLPLLTAAQERAIFTQYNYARYRAEQARQSIHPKRMSVKKCRDMIAWHERALELREKIAEYNLALVLAMAKRLPAGSVDMPEMISEGNMALLRGIDKFDVSKGFKFSTYACRAIIKAFSRLGKKTTRYRSLFPVGFEPDLERSNYNEEKADAQEQACVEELSRIFRENKSGLTDLERDIIEKRFSFDDPDRPKRLTLMQVGKMVGLTKERVRQIQIHALEKMRNTLEESYLDGPSLSETMDEAEVTMEDLVSAA